MIALITPTGARPTQIAFCARWMQSQTYKGKVIWIIADDCLPRTTDFLTDGFRESWTIHKIYPQPPWQHGQNTQGRNLSVAVNFLRHNYNLKDIEAIFIIEDDDFYKPHYLENMMGHIQGYRVTGETHTIYYNVNIRTHVTNQNATWSSLFQTAFTPDAIADFEKCYTNRFIDSAFFMYKTGVNLFRDDNLGVGIKGLPGRYGIGAGHNHAFALLPDPNLTYLKMLIGEENAILYSGYYRDNSKLRNNLFTKRCS
jgi:hypothetical protein